MYHIAKAKKKENIIEYLLFMWQMEDLLRGVKFDIEALQHEILAGISDEKSREESLNWFKVLAEEMKSDDVMVSGHHRETYELLNELQMLQQTLMTVLGDEKFKASYGAAKPLLDEFRQKTERIPRGDIEIALTAIYGMLTLKLAGKTVSPETRAAVEVFSKYLRHLASAYRDMKAGTLPMNN